MKKTTTGFIIALASLGVVIVVALLMLGPSGLRDELHWSWATRQNNAVTAYGSYLSSWPSGRHAAEGKVTLEDIQWAEAQRGDQAKDYASFLKSWPAGRHSSEAEVLYDTKSWSSAAASDTTQSLERYLVEHPRGARVQDARRRVEELDKLAGAFSRRVATLRDDESMIVFGFAFRSNAEAKTSLRLSKFGFVHSSVRGSDPNLLAEPYADSTAMKICKDLCYDFAGSYGTTDIYSVKLRSGAVKLFGAVWFNDGTDEMVNVTSGADVTLSAKTLYWLGRLTVEKSGESVPGRPAENVTGLIGRLEKPGESAHVFWNPDPQLKERFSNSLLARLRAELAGSLVGMDLEPKALQPLQNGTMVLLDTSGRIYALGRR